MKTSSVTSTEWAEGSLIYTILQYYLLQLMSVSTNYLCCTVAPPWVHTE